MPVPTDLSKLSNVIKNDFIKKAAYNKLVAKVDNIDPNDFVLKTLYFVDKIPNISNLVKKSDYNIKITSIESNVKKLQVYDLSYFRSKQYFDEGDAKQNYLVFLPIRKYLKLNTVVGVIDRVLSWQSKGLSNESIKPPATSNNSLNPKLSYYDTKLRVQFTRSCLKQPNFIFTHKKVVNIYIICKLGASSSHNNDPTLNIFLFGAVTLTKNADIEKYKYSGYGIGFYRRGSFSFPGGGFSQNVIIFGVDMSSSIHIDNKKKDIISIRKRTSTRIREYSNCRKNVFY